MYHYLIASIFDCMPWGNRQYVIFLCRKALGVLYIGFADGMLNMLFPCQVFINIIIASSGYVTEEATIIFSQ